MASTAELTDYESTDPNTWFGEIAWPVSRFATSSAVMASVPGGKLRPIAHLDFAFGRDTTVHFVLTHKNGRIDICGDRTRSVERWEALEADSKIGEVVYVETRRLPLGFVRGESTWTCHIDSASLRAVYVGGGRLSVSGAALDGAGVLRGERSANPFLLFSGLVHAFSGGLLIRKQRYWGGGLYRNIAFRHDVHVHERASLMKALLVLAVVVRYEYCGEKTPRH